MESHLVQRNEISDMKEWRTGEHLSVNILCLVFVLPDRLLLRKYLPVLCWILCLNGSTTDACVVVACEYTFGVSCI